MSAAQELNSCPAPAQPDEAPLHLRPAVDLVENEHEFLMSVEMPGVDPAGVDVGIEKIVLTISGKASFTPPGSHRLVAGDAGPRVYERSFQLSEDIARDGIEAEMKHGVLTLKLPKSQQAKKIAISVREA
jgi:HSP20 family molecular chaperone IbpA